MDSLLDPSTGPSTSSGQAQGERGWIPAFAGMTVVQRYPLRGKGEEACKRKWGGGKSDVAFIE